MNSLPILTNLDVQYFNDKAQFHDFLACIDAVQACLGTR
jgi:hypothetical protein